jgi:hypothetical protein
LCGASRLARFNTSHDPQPRNPGRMDRKYFVGMPIPAAAGMIAATVHFCYGFPIPYWWLAVLWIGLVGLLGFLMVSTWRFWSGKEINFGRRQPFQLLMVLAIVLFVLIWYSSGALFFVALVYMFSGIWARAAYSWSRRRRHMPRGEAEAGTEARSEARTSGRQAPAFTAEYAQQDPAASAAEDEYARLHAHPHAANDENVEAGQDLKPDLRPDLRPDSRPDGY